MTSISNEAVDEFDVNATTSEAAKVRNLRLGIFSAVQAVCIFAGGVALADDQSACQQFTWSIARENTAFSAPNLDAVHSGTVERALPERGIALKLDPISSVSYSLPIERKPKRENGFGAVVKFASPPQAGVYQVTLSDEAWIDVIQDGHFLPSKAHSGKKGCPGVRKSVRFDFQAAPIVLQLSDVSTDTINVAVLPAE